MLNGQVAVDANTEGNVFDIQQLVSLFARVIFVFTPRRCNRAAHAVARFVFR